MYVNSRNKYIDQLLIQSYVFLLTLTDEDNKLMLSSNRVCLSK